MAETLADTRLEEFLREMPQATKEEITEFRQLVERYFLGQITPDEFKAKRLHMGTYGIRGVKDIHMMRIKIPAGKLNAEQLECLADLAEQYSKSIGHITTRQDMQLYWIPTKEAPKAIIRAAAVGLTTREACGNSVRNVTACYLAGVSPTELFDVTQHAEAVMRHFLRNPCSQKLPRKFKIAFEGCPTDHAKTAIHDIGAVAAVKEEGGTRILGFKIYVGGGLGAAPMQAILLEPFTPATELLRTCEAAVRVHDRLGDRKNKATARIKFVVKRLGPDAFRKEVFEERAKLPQYPYPEMHVTETNEQPPKPVDIKPATPVNTTYARWMLTNVTGQKQAGYSTVIIRLQLGDISSSQMRALAKIIRRYCGGIVRTMITQNLALRWIRTEHLAPLFNELHAVGLAEPEAERLYDVTSCPGAETCQLGISASRGLARALEARLKASGLGGEDLDRLHIKVSGCPNSCGQHHIADIGFFGGAKKVNDHLTPHFQLMLGGLAEEGKAEFGQPILKLPARRIPDAVIRILERYRQDRQSVQEPFKIFARRVGIDYWKRTLEEFTTLPAYETSPEAYRDWGAEEEFSLGGMGPGECAA
ncbi:MAG: nitrite/sulfite reductase [Candidatus Omnitrophica bacterium]|nr:nitrite/sulfite reductase [Candidatus Omnitrophota bacterium]